MKKHYRPPSLSASQIRALTLSLSIRSLCLFLFATMEDSSRSSPIAYSGGLSTGEEAYLAADFSAQAGSAAGSLQGEGLLSGSGGDGGGSGSSSDAEFGFQRTEFGRAPLAGTVQAYDRHVFLCYKTPKVWPSHVEAAESDRLPRLLSAALAARKGEMKKQTRLTICEGEDGTESSNGDVLIFPDMIRYRGLTHFDIDNFVEEVLVKDTEWLPGTIETLKGSYVFVCAHGSRDRRCGVCGPVLIKKFNEELDSRGLQGQVFVSPCSHIGGHKYAGNAIIFRPNIDGEVTGHWYGYVAPDDVPILLEQHICKGCIVHHLWRGQMGLSEEDQKKAQELRLQLIDGMEEKIAERSIHETGAAGAANGTAAAAAAAGGGCCQGVENSTCCQNGVPKEKLENDHVDEEETHKIDETKRSNGESKASSSSQGAGGGGRKICPMPTWYESWEREDTYAAVAVAAAVASVAVAYSFYKQLR